MSTVTTGLARGAWTSRAGFILAAAGSAIGLGNIWRFPTTAGEYGGGAFVLVYLGFVLLVGIPVLLAELSVGRATERNPVGAFKALVPGSWWPAVGALGVLTGFGILSFYSVIAGWTLGYLWLAVTGAFSGALSSEESGAIFQQLVGNPLLPTLLALAFLVLTALIVRGGISGGIERASRILMPAFFVILLILTVRAVTLPGAGKGLEFLFTPDFSEIHIQVVANALGQALFSLSLGMGAMITYGSYLQKRESLPIVGFSVALFDTLIALMGGVLIFSALAFAGAESTTSGPGLVFVALPTIFHTLPFGTGFAIAFYALLAIAALTSTISLLEVIVSYLVDQRGWARARATWGMALACAVLSIPSALSLGGSPFFTRFVGEVSFLDLMNIVWGNYSLSLGAMAICLFVGWKWGVRNALAEIQAEGNRFALAPLWSFLVRFVCPLGVAAVLAYIIFNRQYF